MLIISGRCKMWALHVDGQLLALINVGVACWLLYCGAVKCWRTVVKHQRCSMLALHVGWYIVALTTVGVARRLLNFGAVNLYVA